jgi:hypothetical protein
MARHRVKRCRAKASLAVAVAAALAFGLAACGGPMRPEELGRSVDTLASAAAEGGLIAADVGRHRTKRTFVRVRTRELGETVDHEVEKLSDAKAREGIADEKLAAVELAERISELLGQIQASPDNGDVAAEAKRKLDDLSRRAEELSKSL